MTYLYAAIFCNIMALIAFGSLILGLIFSDRTGPSKLFKDGIAEVFK